ncbi:dihydroxy-acid dehydratase [Faecalicatena acetigenes]|uniref:Dihydroxy-acid dehydratase n=1 Tax=Faecalicatena acetigenes TaxID=2981790 RepID=A0ABT2TCI6_9FIRM|nr:MULTISPECIES: dihydroxy-acid dehydratase [Lachnospiraceae]MCU6747989.1 dihydroxy-acid dehydratase [Faecalicatena acetigenes]SCI21066.1 Dihydroxy-acid dehydratase [uncultured Clostridium sp.]
MKEFTQKYFVGDAAAHSRSVYKGSGYDPQDLNRPHIGIGNTFSENSAGHAHLRELADAVKSAIWQAGGIPFEFGLPSTCAEVAIGSDTMCMDLAMRDIVAAGIEVVASVQHFDGLVLLSGCDNIVPGTLLAAARLDIPTICCTGGPMLSGRLNGKQFLQCDVTEFSYGQISKGNADKEAILQAECQACPSMGACSNMGTANTMQILTEALGMTLPGSSTIPAVYTDKIVSCKHIGRRIVEMVFEDLTPSKIITREALENAIRMDLAIGGSTNAVMHIPALANELGIDMTADEFEKFNRTTPCIANVRPSGIYAVDDLHFAGGVPQLFKQLEPLIHKECLNVNGQTLGEILEHVNSCPSDVIRSMKNPISENGGLCILKGNLAPNGSVVRSSTVKKSMLHFRGTAKVYQSDSEAHQAIISEKVQPGDVVVVRNVGPVGAPGMVEVMEATEAIVNLGLDESVSLITDGRFSGFCHGPIIGHVSPEAAIGGAIALIKDDDMIEIDIPNRSLKLDVSEEELEKRRKNLVLPEPKRKKGFMRTYAKNCLPPEKGAAMQSWD